MKRIEFGFANEDNPKGSWQGIGIEEGLMLTDAAYYGSIGYNGDNFIVAKVDKDEYGRYPSLLNKFIVRDAIVDVYADGSNILFLNKEVSHNARGIEEVLNNEKVSSRINSIQDVINFCDGISASSRLFCLAEMEKEITATSIKNDVFTEKNEAIKNCHQSLSDMLRETNSNYRTR